jgi:hypothetical protein
LDLAAKPCYNSRVTDTPAGALCDARLLVTDSWRLFKARFGILMLIAALGSLATLFCALAPLLAAGLLQIWGPTGPLVWVAAGLAGLSAALWAGSWAQVAACDTALAQDGAVPPFGQALRRAWPRVAPFSWVCLLYLVIVGGGLFFFIVPGLYLGAVLVFAPFVALEEGLTGVAALERSMEYSRGRFGPLSGRLAVIGLLGGLPSVIPLVGPILGAVLSPLPLVALAALYRDVRRAPAAGPVARWPLALAAAAWLVPAAVAARVVPELARKWPEIRAQADRFASLDPQQAQKVLEAIQSGQSTPETALAAAQLLSSAPPAAGVSLSTEAAPAPAAAAPAPVQPGAPEAPRP